MSGFDSWVYSYSRRGRCGKVGIPRTLRDFQARWKSLLWGFSTERLFHRCWRGVFGRCDGHTLGGETSQPMRPVGEADGSIQMLVNHDDAAGQRSSPVHPLDLQTQLLKADRVVPVHGALKLQGKDQVQIFAGASHKGTAALRRRNLKAAIELVDVV